MAKRRMYMVIMCSVLAIVIAVFHFTGIIKNFDSYLAMTYMSYFLGVALLYLSSYHKEREHFGSMYLCFFVSTILIILSIAALIYGFITGEVSLFF